MADIEQKYYYKKAVNCPHCHKDIDLKDVHITRTKEYYGDKRVKLTNLIDFAQATEMHGRKE